MHIISINRAQNLSGKIQTGKKIKKEIKMIRYLANHLGINLLEVIDDLLTLILLMSKIYRSQRKKSIDYSELRS
jgi:hypothetical protein